MKLGELFWIRWKQRKPDPARSQRDGRTYGITFLPSGDSSWTYVPVRYLWTSADLPLARLPTMPWGKKRDRFMSDLCCQTGRDAAETLTTLSSGTVRLSVHSWLFTNASVRQKTKTHLSVKCDEHVVPSGAQACVRDDRETLKDVRRFQLLVLCLKRQFTLKRACSVNYGLLL